MIPEHTLMHFRNALAIYHHDHNNANDNDFLKQVIFLKGQWVNEKVIMT